MDKTDFNLAGMKILIVDPYSISSSKGWGGLGWSEYLGSKDNEEGKLKKFY